MLKPTDNRPTNAAVMLFKSVPVLQLIIAGVTLIVVVMLGASALGGASTKESGSARASIADLVVGSSSMPIDASPAVQENAGLSMRITTAGPVLAGSTKVKAASFWGWEWAYVQCITGIGVPIGAAWFIVANPWTWQYVLRQGAVPLSVGRTAYNYINAVKGKCLAYING